MDIAIFSVDVERDLHTLGFKSIEEGIPRLIGLLDKYSIRATFFVTGEVLKKYSRLMKILKSKGHEIAIHSYFHERYDKMSLKEKAEDLEKSIAVYRKLFKKNPKGFRAPQHSIDKEVLILLEKNNFRYDSSMTPLNLMLLRHLLRRDSNKIEVIKNFLSKIKLYKLGKNLKEIPRTSFLVSLGGFEIKLLPEIFYKFIISLNILFKIPVVFVMHSWDMIDIEGSRTTKLCSSEKFYKKLDSFLEYSTNRLNFCRMEDL